MGCIYALLFSSTNFHYKTFYRITAKLENKKTSNWRKTLVLDRQHQQKIILVSAVLRRARLEPIIQGRRYNLVDEHWL
jgi:hypothetical protein